MLAFKKKAKTISRFWEGSIIAFQLQNGQWEKGEITKLQNDSIYIKPLAIIYNFMSIDTLSIPIMGVTLADIYALPKNGVTVDYINGSFQMSKTGSKVKWYWIKSGWIFIVGAAGYAGLNIVNGILQNNFSFSKNKVKLGVSALVFLGGILLHRSYKPTLQLGKKYHLEILKLSLK